MRSVIGGPAGPARRPRELTYSARRYVTRRRTTGGGVKVRRRCRRAARAHVRGHYQPAGTAARESSSEPRARTGWPSGVEAALDVDEIVRRRNYKRAGRSGYTRRGPALHFIERVEMTWGTISNLASPRAQS